MKKDMNELPPYVHAQIRALEELPGDRTDTTDSSEVLDWSYARSGVFCRPPARQTNQSRRFGS